MAFMGRGARQMQSFDRFSRYALSSCVIAAMLAGCGVSQPALPASTAIGSGSAAMRHATSGPYVYTANCCGVLNHGDISVYKPGLQGFDSRIVRGTDSPWAIAVDTSGTVYVVNIFSSIAEFESGNRRASRKLELYGAFALALDGFGNLYVDQCISCIPTLMRSRNRSEQDSILVYAPGQKKPLRTITLGIHEPVAMAVDAAGNVYVGNAGSAQRHASITEYAAGSTSVSRKITSGLKWPGSLAVDGSGDLFAANQGASVIEYAPNSIRRLRTIRHGIAGASAFAIDPAGTLYVGNTGDPSRRGWISVYAPGSSSPAYKISRGINDPRALALDGDDNLYVANWAYGRQGSVTVYAPNTQHPVHSVESGKYGPPLAVALGPQY
jgi:hypothetical protein